MVFEVEDFIPELVDRTGEYMQIDLLLKREEGGGMISSL